MAIIADACWGEGLGVDNLTGIPGIKNLRHVAWPYTASIATATGLKLDPSSGFPFTDPVDGFVQNGIQIAGRAFNTDPGTAGVSMLAGGQGYVSLSLQNTMHRPALCWIVGIFDYHANVTCQGSFSASDSRFLGWNTSIATNSIPGDPALNVGVLPHSVMFGGVITAGFGGAISVGGRFCSSNPLQFLNPGDTINVKSTVGYNRGALGYTVGSYDATLMFNHYLWLVAWTQPPTS